MNKFLFIFFILCSSAFSMTREDYYKFYHSHFIADELDIAENINYLENFFKVNFANPIYAFAKIEHTDEWDKYKALFNMHVSLKLVSLYLEYGDRYFKHEAYFFNSPWKDINLKGLDKAQAIFNDALYYWGRAKEYSAQASVKKFKFLILEDIQYWEDENYRIANKDLDYEKIIQKHIYQIEEVRKKFQNMHSNN